MNFRSKILVGIAFTLAVAFFGFVKIYRHKNHADDTGKIISFLYAISESKVPLNSEVPLNSDNPEWQEYEFWIEGFGRDRFLDRLPEIKENNPSYSDEIEFLLRHYGRKSQARLGSK
ncbi:MAG: hypothetical protein AB7I98_19395 [Verrucomicrobiales bacterium]